MANKSEAESNDNSSLLPANPPSIALAESDVRHVHRRGGYFVGVAGWSGLLYCLAGRLSGFIISGVVWVTFAVGWIAADETVRTTVRGFLGDSSTTLVLEDESRQFPLLATEGYHDLPTSWKQLLAEVQLNQSDYPARLVSTIRELSLKDVRTVDHIAPYVLGNSIIHADDFEMGYEITPVSDTDLERMKTIGITTEGQLGLYREIKPSDGKSGRQTFRGTTLALLIEAVDSTIEDKVHVTSLTEEGAEIIRLLNKPTSLQGVCQIASRLKERKKITVAIVARFESESDDRVWSNADATANVSSLCSRYGLPLQD